MSDPAHPAFATRFQKAINRMHCAFATAIHGATNTNPAVKCAKTPSTLVGKQIKEVGRITTKVGTDDVTAVSITFTDGTKVVAVDNAPDLFKTVKGGALVQIEANGCQYSLK